jgi:alpha-amylase
MKTVNLVLGVHNHQPIGNFDHVFEEACHKAYRPFLDVLDRHPGIRFAFHNTGCLLDWIVEHHPDYIQRLRELVERGQAEILGGAYYEPILPVIPDHDKVGQMRLMNDEIERLFGVRPRGMWLAERVWEPHLPRFIHEAGLEFAALDDSHFKCAGLTEIQTFGYYLTEEAGKAMAVFPINERLRYTIPFHDPADTIDYLRSAATDDGSRLVVMTDDGEKFGIWPETHKHCYEDGWLERFFAALEENASWIRLMSFGEALDRLKPLGRVYLPTASYGEMMEWALPADAVERYEDFVKSLKDRPDFADEKIFVRAGFWRNFLAKYDEGNHMHKRMVRVSEKIASALERQPRSEKLHRAQRALWRGQCNCAYWHGVFGGLYLTHLRSAIYRNLIEADALADQAAHRGKSWTDVDESDLDCDGHKELTVATPAQILIFKPVAGGALVEHDHVAAHFNLIDVLGRRKEGYHRQVIELAQRRAKAEGATASIHERVAAKETGLERLLHYDWHRRASFLDHFIAPDATLDEFAESRQREEGDFVNQPYAVAIGGRPAAPKHAAAQHGASAASAPAGGAEVKLERRGSLYRLDGVFPLHVSKVLNISDTAVAIAAAYRITNVGDRAVRTRFGVEFCVNFLAGNAFDRYYKINGAQPSPAQLASRGADERVNSFGAVDEWLRLEARVTPGEPMALWRFPLETVSLSEDGFERVYQGSVMFAHGLLDLSPGESRDFTFRYEVLPYPSD